MDNVRWELSDTDDKLDWLRKEVTGIGTAIAALGAGSAELAERLDALERRVRTLRSSQRS